MQIVVISSKDKFKSEIIHVIRMFENGLEVFHLRKPKFTQQRMEEYLNLIPEKFHNRIVVHTFHNLIRSYNLKGIHLTKRHKKKGYKTSWRCFWLKLRKPKMTISTSCHDLTKLPSYAKKYDYVMLSPVYDSVSVGGRQAGFAYGTIKKTLNEIGTKNIYALGGVDEAKINDVKLLGFNGVVLLGTIWHTGKNPIEVYNNVVDIDLGRIITHQQELNPVKMAI